MDFGRCRERNPDRAGNGIRTVRGTEPGPCGEQNPDSAGNGTRTVRGAESGQRREAALLSAAGDRLRRGLDRKIRRQSGQARRGEFCVRVQTGRQAV